MLGKESPWRDRPPEVWTMAVMALLGAALCGLSAVRPMSEQAPVAVNATVAVIGLGLAAVLWSAGARLPPTSLHAGLVVCIVSATVIVARSATGEGAMGGAFSYMWMAVYAAVFFSRVAARRYVGLIAVAFGGALLVNAPDDGLISWLVIVSSSAAAGEMLSFLHERMRAVAVTDQLTGLANRTGLVQAGAREIAVAARAGAPLSLALIDLNGFKLVNDRDGHAAGDQLLVELADAWQACLRPGDILARQGGDEFVLLLPATSASDATSLLARLKTASRIAWSCGLVEVRPGEDLDSCLARADRLMYEDKSVRSRTRAANPLRALTRVPT